MGGDLGGAAVADSLEDIRSRITAAKLADEDEHLDALIASAQYPEKARKAATEAAASLVEDIRKSGTLGRMDFLLAEYGLGTGEGLALLRLAEALIRVPDADTADRLIADKIATADWAAHRGKSRSRFVNALTLLLMFGAWCIGGDQRRGALRGAVRRLATPVVRFSARRSIERLAERFVLGRTIGQAFTRSGELESRGYQYSYDMLGEAALTAADAEKFFEDYKNAISALAPKCTAENIHDNHGISIKLSALHPRYELTQHERVLEELGGKVLHLARMAKESNIGIDIDAEEADRLELSMDVIEKVMRDPDLDGWDGFGIVVQAYGKAAPHVLDFLYASAGELGRKIKIRLVKGAYWDSEIKRAQVEGLEHFPVYTRKCATDVSYLCCARKLLTMTERVYPQFAGHNAHTVSSILELVEEGTAFEFQRIHGMGEALHDAVLRRNGTRCRVYAPVGEYRELLPYLARRILENGANSSFVNQIADFSNEPEDVASDPFDELAAARARNVRKIAMPSAIFGDARLNSKGWDLHNPERLRGIDTEREPFSSATWEASPTLAAADVPPARRVPVKSPSNPDDMVGEVDEASADAIDAAVGAARDWSSAAASERASVLRRASFLYEERYAEAFSLLAREAGKSASDAVAELREAVDFLRFYAAEAERQSLGPPLGVVACISPWNFPLAIFTGQVSGALAAGNGVLAKPAEQTPLIARFAVSCLHEAGVPREVLQMLPGTGPDVGAVLAAHPGIAGVAFTGSTATARLIESGIANSAKPSAPLVAETGGINVMLVDSTAQPEQVVRDIFVSAFQSAGQRCSAARMLYIQEDVSDYLLTMLFGAMDELSVGDPWDTSTDVGPLIDAEAHERVKAHVEGARNEGRLMKQCPAPSRGNFVGPTVLKVSGLDDVEEEIFGPVLHVATFRPSELESILEKINAQGFGLTFGMHSRIDARIDNVTARLNIGNIYVNRNQIGAVVGSQPFGGEGMSGTGPKAGGPDYLRGFTRAEHPSHEVETEPVADIGKVQELLDELSRVPGLRQSTVEMPGPTGESNKLSKFPRDTVLCLGPSPDDAKEQAEIALSAGCRALIVVPGTAGAHSVPGYLPRTALAQLRNFGAVALWSGKDDLRDARVALASRKGPLIPLVGGRNLADRCVLERHVCIDTTAAGGNATLFASASGS